MAIPLTLSAEPQPEAPLSEGMVRLSGHVLATLQKATLLKPSSHNDGQPLTVTVVLKRGDQKGFERYLHELYDPHSHNFHHFLAQTEIVRRFGPSQQSYDAALAYLRAHGLRLVEGSANHLTITVRGSRAMVEDAFGLSVDDYRIGKKTFYANDGAPTLPAELASDVAAIVGLSNLAQPVRAGSTAVADSIKGVNKGDLAFSCFLAQYLGLTGQAKTFQTLLGAANSGEIPVLNGINGISILTTILRYECAADELNLIAAYAAKAGGSTAALSAPVSPVTATQALPGSAQRVGLVEFDNFHKSDVQDFLNLFGTGSQISQLSEVNVDGGAGPPGPYEDEVLLDIDAVMSVAPGAQVVVYDGPFSGRGSFQTILNRMITDGVNVISNSWAYCEDQTTLADVQSLDAVLQNAAAAGITVITGAGDQGSTCLDGSVNTVGVPADAAHVTTVGGSTPTFNVGGTYTSETWWNGVGATPPTGQGGFGLSKFFARPAYQDGLNSTDMRSVPDVTAPADPAEGYLICQADAGGCPNNLLYGGTSVAAPIWAAFTAVVNQVLGRKLGFLNPQIYPLSSTTAFHSATSVGSDFAHVGLGSPNLSELSRRLSGGVVGPVSIANSRLAAFPPSVQADGTSHAGVVVVLLDSNFHTVSGQSVTLKANTGAHAAVAPVNTASNVSNGAARFLITDTVPETLTLAAVTSAGTLPQTSTVTFVTPPAAAGGIGANPSTIVADGMSASTITVSLKDAKGNPTPNKEVIISQGNGHSVLNGPTPSVTDSSGQIQFTATDTMTETVGYSATDVTDGLLAVPGTASVSFIKGSPPVCNLSALKPVPGSNFIYTNYITGFPLTSENCFNPSGMAFDSAGNLYVADYAGVSTAAGGVYKFGPGGGTAGIEHRLNPVGYPPSTCAAGLAFSKDGKHLYLARQACSNINAGDVVEISQTDGSVIRTLTHQYCATGLATDPISGDLFFSVPCSSPVPNNNIYRIFNPNSATPTTRIYAAPGGSNQLVFGPDGTLYTESFRFDLNTRFVTAINGTNSMNPGAFTYLNYAFDQASSILPSFNGSNPSQPTFLLSANGGVSPTASGDISLIDLTQNPPAQGDIFNNGPALQYMIGGPDGCAYATEPDRIIRICKSDGSGPFAPSSPQPGLLLSPASISPNPSQGSGRSFTAAFQNLSVPLGTPVFFSVTGANPQLTTVATDASGRATLTYTGSTAGQDLIQAAAFLGAQNLVSNRATVKWLSGKHSTFLTLNQSPRGGMANHAAMLKASLTDISVTPSGSIGGVSIAFGLAGRTCWGTTDAKGNASCILTPTAGGSFTLTASFAGNSSFVAANASTGFTVIGPTPTNIPTSTPKPTPKPTSTATRTPTRIPSHTPTRTPSHTPTRTPSHTPTRTPSHTPTRTASHTPTRTPSHTPTRTATRTPKPTATPIPFVNFGVAVVGDDGSGLSHGLQVMRIEDNTGKVLSTPQQTFVPITSAVDIDALSITADGTHGAVIDGGNTVHFFASNLSAGSVSLLPATVSVTSFGGDGDSIASLPGGDEAMVAAGSKADLALISGILGSKPVVASQIPTGNATVEHDGVVISADGKVMLSRSGIGGSLDVYSVAAVTPHVGSLGVGSVAFNFTLTKTLAIATAPSLDGREGMALSPADSSRAVLASSSGVFLVTGLPSSPTVHAAVKLAATPNAVMISRDGKYAIIAMPGGLVVLSGVSTGTLAQLGTVYSATFAIPNGNCKLASPKTLGVMADGKYVVTIQNCNLTRFGTNIGSGVLLTIPFSAGTLSAPVGQLNYVVTPINDQLLTH